MKKSDKKSESQPALHGRSNGTKDPTNYPNSRRSYP
jgi:hypothetical protein